MRGIRKSTPHSNAANAVNVANAAKVASLAVAAMMALALSVSGCALEVPADPDGTLDRIEDEGILRAGVSPDPQAVQVNGGKVEGRPAELVEDFARLHGAEVEWQIGSEETLVTALESRKLDVVIGGITAQSPWSERVGITRGYPALDERERPRDLAFLVPLGQNRLLSELEIYADAEAAP